MPLAQITVILGGIAAIGFLVWFFLRPKRAWAAQTKGNVQEVEVIPVAGHDKFKASPEKYVL